MTTLIEFLDEIERSHETVVIPAEEAERLVARFGPRVRSMGFWDKTGDSSIQVPMGNVIEAVQTLGGELSDAVAQLKSADLAADSSARRLVETLAEMYLSQFKARVECFQSSSDPAESDRLWRGIERDLFGV